MADRQAGPRPRPPVDFRSGGVRTLAQRIQDHSPTSSQVIGFLTLAISGAILLLLTGVTVTGATLGLIVLAPLLLLTSPVWVPAAVVGFLLLTVAATAVCAAVATVATATWLYRYFTGRHPVGSEQVNYARHRIADTASQVKDYAREYGGYLQSRIKDAAPGA
ncbi:Oleosin 16 kDa [Apostasia shenzhenica]|uniref:Oleosin 16 kDa n=1 Tax=Apostasia shenzhenica TaxID=1088818 RepID=A0A2I0B9V4_9ASPA|nr:Oleosin 16 kDa [Apostasia shenzhenica]